MTYVALLRGINVGGKSRVEMARLKVVFEGLGFDDVKTYINSGNIIFTTGSTKRATLIETIEKAIEKEFGIAVRVILRSAEDLKAVVDALSEDWTNDKTMKCDVMFLWEEVDSVNVLEKLPPFNPDYEDVLYVAGAVIWRVDRDYITKTKLTKLIGTPLYKHMTLRNCNTVRKLYSLMQDS